MSFRTMLRHEVVVYNRDDTTTDRYGNSVESFDTGTTYRALVIPQSSDESLGLRDTTVEISTIYLPNEVTLDAFTQIEYRSERYNVRGHPRIHTGHNGDHHQEALIERIEG